MGRVRRVPYLVLGVLLVVGCALAAVTVALRLDDRYSVLVLARAVTVGHVLVAQDFAHASVPVDGGLDAVAVTEMSTVVGRPAAYSLPAGAMITRQVVGDPAIPADGQAVAAVALADGQFPPTVAPGTRVSVVLSVVDEISGVADPAAAPDAVWAATVLEVAPSRGEQSTVVSLVLPEDYARSVAAASPDGVRLVAVAGDR